VLPATAEVGKGVVFGCQGLCIVVHARAKIGNNVIIGTNVTIGGRSGMKDVPVIWAGVLIGTGAKILGSVVIGNNVEIGANAVVLKHVPDNAVVVGVPAKLIKFKK
jgi:serine O-acetyltransferase